MGGAVNMTQDGRTYAVPEDQVEAAKAQGYTEESAEASVKREGDAIQSDVYGGAGGKILAALSGGARGLSMGASDLALSALGAGHSVRALRDVNPITSIGSEIVGNLAGAVTGIGPAGAVAKAGTAVAELGAGAGLAGKLAATVAGGALEGGAQGAGTYLSSVALDDKPLSAEGFIGAAGEGALIGGGVAGALGVSEAALTRAKSLFTRGAVTREAAHVAEQAATSEIASATADGDQLLTTAKSQLEANRLRTSANNAETAEKLNALKVQEAEQRVAREQARTQGVADREAAKTAKASTPRGRKSRKAFEEPAPVIPATAADVTEDAVTTVPARDLDARGVGQQPGVGDDAVKMDKARKAIADGQRDPVKIAVSPGGKLEIVDGRHRLAAAVEADAPIKVQWSKGTAGLDDGDPALMAQLGATKQALDDGADLGELSARRTADDVVAEVDPNHGKLADATRELETAKTELDAWLGKYGGKQGNVGRFERSQAARDYAENMRPTKDGYYSRVPEGEGTGVLARGREWEYRGTPEAQARAEKSFMRSRANPSTYERRGATVHDPGSLDAYVDGELAAKEMTGRWKGPRSQGEEILASAESPVAEVVESAAPTVQDQVSSALRVHAGEHASMEVDLHEAAQVIGRYEKASADVAEMLGPEAPMGSMSRAQQYRAAVEGQQDSAAAQTASTADDMAKAMPADVNIPGKPYAPTTPSNVGAAAGAGAKSGVAGEALDILGLLDMAGDIGVGHIPVIGPLLKLYLKGRALMSIFKRAGGSIPKTVESTIAQRAAATQDRVRSAVDKMLTVGARGARAARPVAGPLAALGTKLFDAPAPRNDDKPRRKDGAQADYGHRMVELSAAARPGAIAALVRSKVPTGDAALQAAVVDTLTRKLTFLDSKAPKAPTVPTLLRGDGKWQPSKTELERFGRYIEAANDPASVLESLAHNGMVTLEGAETLRTVYPALYRQAQMRLLERAPDIQATLPYSRRIALSVLFQVPVDGTMDASFLTFLQQGNPPAANAATPAQGSPAPAGLSPTAIGPVNLGDRTMTRLDRRAGA